MTLRQGERDVILVNGDTVSNYSPEYILQSEARHICRLPRKVDRRIYLAGVEKRRGLEARDVLEAWVHLVWKADGFGRDD